MEAYYVAPWGVVLTFLRVRPGSETAVLKRLQLEGKRTRLYWCFGHYDILQLDAIDRPHPLPAPPSDPDIYQAVLLTALSWKSPVATPELSGWLDAPGATVSLLKLNPAALEEIGLELELLSVNYLSQNVSPYVLSSLGHSEMVVFMPHDDLAALLVGVTKTSRLEVADVIPDREGTSLGRQPLFAKSHTVPLASFTQVIEPGKFDDLKGFIQPVLRISCRPSAERRVLRLLPADPKFDVSHAYGRYDLEVRYGSQMSAGSYLKGLLEFRHSMRDSTDLYQTVTDLLTADDDLARPPDAVVARHGSRRSESEAFANVELVHSLSRQRELPANLRRMLAEFEARYLACEADQYLSTEYRDMQGFIHHLAANLTEALNEFRQGLYSDYYIRIASLESQLEVATAALYQRYASVEAHLQGASFPIFASCVGFNRVIAAASRIIQAAYNSAFLARRDEVWAGFVCFWEGGFLHSSGDVYTLLADSVLAPLAWGPMTHELGHGAATALDLKLTKPDRLAEYCTLMSDLGWSYSSLGSPDKFLRELFAHWFDLSYFHPEMSAAEFVSHMWGSWINVPAVWLFKRHYLLRSLLVFSLDEGKEGRLQDALGDRTQRIAYLEELRDRMTGLLRESVPDFHKYLSDVDERDWTEIYEVALPGLRFLFAGCYETRDQQLMRLINSASRGVDSQADRILLGNVVTGGIDNPLQLLKKVAARASVNDFAASMALVISLAYDFRSEQLRSARPAPRGRR